MIGIDKIKISDTLIEEKIEEAKSKCEFIKQNGQKIWEDELLDKYSVVIEEDDPAAQNKEKKAMKKIKASEMRK